MLTRNSLAAITFVVLALPTSLPAGQVIVKGVHLCCGGCVKGVAAALKDVPGVSNTACDRESMTVTFDAAKAGDAQAGINALAAAGFAGTATEGDANIPFPDSGVKNVKGNSVTLSGVHLCCGKCVEDAVAALTGVDGIESNHIEVDRAASTITVKKERLNAAKVVQALNDAGFYGKAK